MSGSKAANGRPVQEGAGHGAGPRAQGRLGGNAAAGGPRTCCLIGTPMVTSSSGGYAADRGA